MVLYDKTKSELLSDTENINDSLKIKSMAAGINTKSIGECELTFGNKSLIDSRDCTKPEKKV